MFAWWALVNIQWNVLRQTAKSRREGSPTFGVLTPSPPSGCCWWLGRTKTNQFWFYQATSNTLKVGMEAVPIMLENLHILMQLTAWEHFIGVCHHKSFKTYILWTWWGTLRFHKMQGSFWLVEELLASQEWLSSMDLVFVQFESWSVYCKYTWTGTQAFVVGLTLIFVQMSIRIACFCWGKNLCKIHY